MKEKSWIKVYLNDDIAKRICILGGGDSYEYLTAGIHTALNLALGQLLVSPNSDQLHGRTKLG